MVVTILVIFLALALGVAVGVGVAVGAGVASGAVVLVVTVVWLLDVVLSEFFLEFLVAIIAQVRPTAKRTAAIIKIIFIVFDMVVVYVFLGKNQEKILSE